MNTVRLLVAAASFGVAFSPAVSACELPVDEQATYAANRDEERPLARQAFARADLVAVGTVRAIRHGPATASPDDRVSTIDVDLDEFLKTTSVTPEVVSLEGRLHVVVVGCFDNAAFWDDQVEVGGEYLFYVTNGRILAAIAPSGSGAALGLQGQRELIRTWVATERGD